MKRAIKVILLSSFFASLAGGLFGPIYAIFVQGIGGNLIDAGTSYAVFSIVSGILIYVLGKWEDHVKHQEKLVVVARVMLVLGFAGYLIVRSPLQLFIVQAILGISEAVSTPAMDSIYSKNVSRKKSASEWGTWESMYAIVVGVAAIIGGVLAQEFGFKILFLIMFIISICSLIASLLLLKKIKTLLN